MDTTFRSAIIREAREEAGLTLCEESLELVHVMHRRAGGERVSLFFEAGEWVGEAWNMEPHKCDDLGWYAPAEQDADLVPYVRSALENLLCGQPYSEYGWP